MATSEKDGIQWTNQSSPKLKGLFAELQGPVACLNNGSSLNDLSYFKASSDNVNMKMSLNLWSRSKLLLQNPKLALPDYICSEMENCGLQHIAFVS